MRAEYLFVPVRLGSFVLIVGNVSLPLPGLKALFPGYNVTHHVVVGLEPY